MLFGRNRTRHERKTLSRLKRFMRTSTDVSDEILVFGFDFPSLGPRRVPGNNPRESRGDTARLAHAAHPPIRSPGNPQGRRTFGSTTLDGMARCAISHVRTALSVPRRAPHTPRVPRAAPLTSDCSDGFAAAPRSAPKPVIARQRPGCPNT